MALADTQFVRGAARLGQRIATIRAAYNLPKLTDEIGNLLLKRTLQRFDREVDPDGNHWRPLAVTTLARRVAEGYGEGPILQRTRQLRNSITLIRGAATGMVYTNTGASVRIGVADEDQVDKARAHQYGTMHMPRRRFLGIGRLDIKAVDTLLRRKATQLHARLG